MALNSLYPDGWFALGAAALKVTYYSLCILYAMCCNGKRILHHAHFDLSYLTNLSFFLWLYNITG